MSSRLVAQREEVQSSMKVLDACSGLMAEDLARRHGAIPGGE